MDRLSRLGRAMNCEIHHPAIVSKVIWQYEGGPPPGGRRGVWRDHITLTGTLHITGLPQGNATVNVYKPLDHPIFDSVRFLEFEHATSMVALSGAYDASPLINGSSVDVIGEDKQLRLRVQIVPGTLAGAQTLNRVHVGFHIRAVGILKSSDTTHVTGPRIVHGSTKRVATPDSSGLTLAIDDAGSGDWTLESGDNGSIWAVKIAGLISDPTVTATIIQDDLEADTNGNVKRSPTIISVVAADKEGFTVLMQAPDSAGTGEIKAFSFIAIDQPESP